uniref:14-3-3 domain-containing protein n=1 Tax=Acrobeloides nanus TaxID=290746 RepID=A0A914DI77_9BILA
MKIEELVWKAKIAEYAGRHEDVVKVLKRIVELDLTGEISADARHMFETAYKQLVSNIRTSWRIVSNREQQTGNELTRKIAAEYRKNLAQELRELCTEIITTIDEHLMPKVETSDEEAKIYYLKAKADYYRYICEIITGDESKHKEMAEKARIAYETAFELAKDKLPLAHPTRLGLALNLSVFCYEIAKEAEKAVQLANQIGFLYIGPYKLFFRHSTKRRQSWQDLTKNPIKKVH